MANLRVIAKDQDDLHRLADEYASLGFDVEKRPGFELIVFGLPRKKAKEKSEKSVRKDKNGHKTMNRKKVRTEQKPKDETARP